MKFLLLFLSLLFSSCIEPMEKIELKNPYVGYLHANSCVGGASYLVYREKQYSFGSKSTADLNRTVAAIGQGRPGKAKPMSFTGCEKVFKMEFSGEFEKENALTGYDNDEPRQVVQVYQFRLL